AETGRAHPQRRRNERRADEATYDPKQAGEEGSAAEQHEREACPGLRELPVRRELAGGVMRVPDVAIPVVRQVRVLMMGTVEFAESLDRGEGRPHHEDIGEQVVLPARRQYAVMRSVVPENQKRVLPRAYEHDGENV